MYLLEAGLQNIKCFTNTRIDFRDKNDPEGVRRWTVLLGENGLGKSTLLQAFAVPLAGPAALRELLPRATGWPRNESPFGEITATIQWSEGDAQLPRWPKKTPYDVRFVVTGDDLDRLPDSLKQEGIETVVDWNGGPSLNARERETVSKAMSRLRQTAYAESKDGWLACGYGPFRRLFGGSQDADQILYAERRAAQFVTLFREDAALSSATGWLIQLHNLSRDGDQSAERALDVVRESLRNNFLMAPAELVVDARVAALSLNGATAVPLPALSDGYRATLALGLDLLRRLILAFPHSDAPQREAGVVLIDELDAHLHPNWQRQIGPWLLEKFPRLQFIVATHSPYLSQVVEASNFVLKPRGAAVTISRDSRNLVDWTVEQVLTELLGLESRYSIEFHERLDRYIELRRQSLDGHLEGELGEEFEQLRLWTQSLNTSDLDLLPALAEKLRGSREAKG